MFLLQALIEVGALRAEVDGLPSTDPAAQACLAPKRIQLEVLEDELRTDIDAVALQEAAGRPEGVEDVRRRGRVGLDRARLVAAAARGCVRPIVVEEDQEVEDVYLQMPEVPTVLEPGVETCGTCR